MVLQKQERSDPKAFSRYRFIAESTCTTMGQINCSPLQNRQSVKSLFKKRKHKSILALEGLNTSSSVWKQNKTKKNPIPSVISSALTAMRNHILDRGGKKKTLPCGGSMQQYNVQGTVFSVRRQQQRKSSVVNNRCGEKTNHNQWQL